MNELLFYDLKNTSGPIKSLATEVAQKIGRKIVARDYFEGALINDEAKLAAEFTVSRSVVRDAVKILVGKGLLEVRRGIGTRVRDRHLWNLLDDDVLAWHLNTPISDEDLHQLLDMRFLMEPKAAKWAAQRATEEEQRAIHAACDAMERDLETIEAFVIADATFHRTILRAANNAFLRALEGVIYSSLLSLIRRTNSNPNDSKASIPLHREVADAIAARNGAEAEAAMTRLLEDAINNIGKPKAGFA